MFNIANGEEIVNLNGIASTWSLDFSSDGKEVLVGMWNGIVSILKTPILNRKHLLEESGKQTNLRVCKNSTAMEVVHVLPYPDPKSTWAPDKLCTKK